MRLAVRNSLPPRTREGNAGPILAAGRRAVVFHPQSTVGESLGTNRTVVSRGGFVVWNTDSWHSAFPDESEFPGDGYHTDLKSLALSETGQYLAVTNITGLRVFDLDRDALLYTLSPNAPYAQECVALSGNHMFSLCSDSRTDRITLRDIRTGATIASIRCGCRLGYWEEIVGFTVISEGRYLVYASREEDIPLRNVAVVDVATGRNLLCREMSYDLAMSVLPNGTAFLGTEDGPEIWDLPGQRLLRQYVGEDREFCSATLAQDSKKAMFGDDRGMIWVWNFGGEGKPKAYDAHASRVSALSMIDNSNLFVSVAGDGFAKLWDAEHGTLVSEVNVGAGLTCCRGLNRSTVLVGGQKGQLFVLDINRSTD